MDKRKSTELDQSGSDSEDDFGPTPDANYNPETKLIDDKKNLRKKARLLEFENVYLENLPSANCYEFSLMHRFIKCFILHK